MVRHDAGGEEFVAVAVEMRQGIESELAGGRGELEMVAGFEDEMINGPGFFEVREVAAGVAGARGFGGGGV